MQASRTISKTTVSSGEKVTLTYVIKNTGEGKITGISIVDAAVGGTVASGVSLSPGESKQYTKTITVTKNTKSSPQVTYTTGGSQKTTNIAAVDINVSTSPANMLSITAKADKTTAAVGDTVTFTITLTNKGGENMTGIKLVNEQGEVIREDMSLGAGKSAKITVKSTIEEGGRSARFTATYTVDGKKYTAESGMINIVTDTQVKTDPITVSASASPFNITEFPASVTFTVTVSNNTSGTLTNVKVSEMTLGEIGSVASLAAKEQKTFTKTVEITSPGSFMFDVVAKNAKGEEVSASSPSVSILSALATETPEQEEPSSANSIGTLLVVFIIIVVLIVITGIALIVLIVLEKKSKKNGPKGSGPKGGKKGRRPAAKGRNAAAARPVREFERSGRDSGRGRMELEDRPKRRPISEEDRPRRKSESFSERPQRKAQEQPRRRMSLEEEQPRRRMQSEAPQRKARPERVERRPQAQRPGRPERTSRESQRLPRDDEFGPRRSNRG